MFYAKNCDSQPNIIYQRTTVSDASHCGRQHFSCSYSTNLVGQISLPRVKMSGMGPILTRSYFCSAMLCLAKHPASSFGIGIGTRQYDWDTDPDRSAAFVTWTNAESAVLSCSLKSCKKFSI